MSILSKLKTNTAAITVAVDTVKEAEAVLAAIDAGFAACSAEIETLTTQASKLALEGTDDAYAECEGKLEAVKRQREKLRLKRVAAQSKLRSAQQEQLKLANAGHIKVARKFASNRAEAAQHIETAITDLVRGYGKLHASNTRLALSWPGGLPPFGAVITARELINALETEMYRQGANPALDPNRPPTLPGGRLQSLEFRGQPERLPAITASIAAANEHLIKVLTGELPATDDVPVIASIEAEPPVPTQAPSTINALTAPVGKIRMQIEKE